MSIDILFMNNLQQFSNTEYFINKLIIKSFTSLFLNYFTLLLTLLLTKKFIEIAFT